MPASVSVAGRGLAWLAVVLTGGVVVAVVAGYRRHSAPPARFHAVTDRYETIESQPSFYQPEHFTDAIAATTAATSRADIHAIIVPHHLVALRWTAELLSLASGRPVERVIIVGPNHRDRGTQPVATTVARWATPVGAVLPDVAAVHRLAAIFSIQPNASVFRHEHAVGAIMPLVAHYFPQAQVVPVILHSGTSVSDVQRLSEWLIAESGRTLVVYSIDFSHYLTVAEAAARDSTTAAVMAQGDVARAIRLDNTADVDSPATLATALSHAQQAGLTTTVLHHGNSNDFTTPQTPEITSYFAILFSRPAVRR